MDSKKSGYIYGLFQCLVEVGGVAKDQIELFNIEEDYDKKFTYLDRADGALRAFERVLLVMDLLSPEDLAEFQDAELFTEIQPTLKSIRNAISSFKFDAKIFIREMMDDGEEYTITTAEDETVN